MRVEQQTASPPIFSGHAALPGAQQASASGLDALPGLGGSALARAVERWRRALLHDHAQPTPSGPSPAAGAAASSVVASVASFPASAPADADALAALARRLDDSGCSYGRVSSARLDGVIRASDRMETKLNAVLMAVTGTFLSTLAGLLLYYVRGGGQ